MSVLLRERTTLANNQTKLAGIKWFLVKLQVQPHEIFKDAGSHSDRPIRLLLTRTISTTVTVLVDKDIRYLGLN